MGLGLVVAQTYWARCGLYNHSVPLARPVRTPARPHRQRDQQDGRRRGPGAAPLERGVRWRRWRLLFRIPRGRRESPTA